jgi:ribosomal protein S1
VSLVDPVFEEEFKEEYSKLETPELRRGAVVRGKVISIDKESVIVNISYKYDGILFVSEFGGHLPEIGEEIPVIVRRIDDRAGVVWLSFKNAARKEVIQKLTALKEKDQPIEGKILRRIKGGYLIELGLRYFKGVLLDELSGLKPEARLEIGEEIKAYIDAIDFRRNRVILDRERLLKETKEKELLEFLSKLQVGQKLKGTIKNVTDFGIFVNVGPADVLIRRRELAWKRFNHPSELFNPGDEVEFIVTSIDLEKKKVQGSIKQATKTRWHLLAENVKVGQVFEATVKKKTEAGLFVWLQPGLDGLLPKEEFSKYIRDVASLQEGEPIRVKVKSVNLPARLIVLTHPTR